MQHDRKGREEECRREIRSRLVGSGAGERCGRLGSRKEGLADQGGDEVRGKRKGTQR